MNNKQQTHNTQQGHKLNTVKHIPLCWLFLICIFPGVFGAFFSNTLFYVHLRSPRYVTNSSVLAPGRSQTGCIGCVLGWRWNTHPFWGDETLRWRVPYGIFVSVGNLEQEGVSKYTFGWINLQLISNMFCRNKEMQNDPVPFTSTNFKIPWVVFVPWSRFAGAWNYDLSWFQYNSRVFPGCCNKHT